MTFSASQTELTKHFDSLTSAEMHARDSIKWGLHGDDVLGAWVAEMDLGTAPAVQEALFEATRTATFGYMPPTVSAATAAALSGYLADEFDWEVPTEDISLLPDVLSSLQGVIAHHTRPGSAVIVPTPAYMPFLSIPGQQGRECVQVPSIRSEGGWFLDLEAIEQAMIDGAGLLILCNPWNPVGRVLTANELDAVAELSAKYGVMVFADEIHAPLVISPGKTHLPYAARPAADPALTFTSTAASKGWNLPGLKCAQLIASGPARKAWNDCALTEHLGFEASTLGAIATTAAFNSGREWMAQVRGYVLENAQFLTQQFDGVDGIDVAIPEGTYLAWLDCSGLDLGEAPSKFFLREARVALNDGAAFGQGYEQFARLNLATGRGILTEAVEKLTDALRG